MLVEFVGCDGAGKTTLMENVQLELRRRQIDASCVTSYLGFEGELSGTEKAADFVRSLLAEPALALYYALHVPREPFLPGRAWSQHARRLYWLLRGACCSSELRRRGGVYLFDEGPMRTVTRIIGRNGPRCHGLLKKVPAPDLVVGLKVDPDVAASRVRERRPNEIPREVIIDRSVTDTAGLASLSLAAPTLIGDTTTGHDYSSAVADLVEDHLARSSGRGVNDR